jgi:hypothetical protein
MTRNAQKMSVTQMKGESSRAPWRDPDFTTENSFFDKMHINEQNMKRLMWRVEVKNF